MKLSEEDYVNILQRHEYDFENIIEHSLKTLAGKKCGITGAAGSLGTQLMIELDRFGIEYEGLDIVASTTHDIRRSDITSDFFPGLYEFDYVFHFAAGKHAPEGEINPDDIIQTNIVGTQTVLSCVSKNSRVVFSSTCKAIAPETVYGATKLIGERLALNAGHSVARYYNVIESSGNVFEIWENTPQEEHYVTDCYRYFITARESLALTLWSAIMPGRWAIDVGNGSYMPEVYQALYGKKTEVRKPRRGDRVVEPRCGKNEERVRSAFHPGIVEIVNYHDA